MSDILEEIDHSKLVVIMYRRMSTQEIQKGPRRLPEASERATKVPKRPARGPQMHPKGSHEAAEKPQEALRSM